ncbi:MAG: hypothetical protein MR051_05270 [Lentisphaeria bacterium]|nr:hypothetical protein [Lentisphaeria bacterium]
MRKSRVLIAALTAAGLLTGCTVIRELPADERRNEPQGAEYELCRTLLKAFIRNDAREFLAHVPPEAREQFNEKSFAATRNSVLESMGEPISFQYVTALELTTFTPHIWKIRFKRVDLKTDKEFTSELLFRILVGKLDGKPVLISFQFL